MKTSPSNTSDDNLRQELRTLLLKNITDNQAKMFASILTSLILILLMLWCSITYGWKWELGIFFSAGVIFFVCFFLHNKAGVEKTRRRLAELSKSSS